ncbi:MAG: YggS family pyridoxal phosphate-dependent enzyme, partial [Candidatus Omnitrophica bacterium]|nr:YggS family pyridoxal phosphate-dependent enzyme [Candidatus Omnitrophota bacterium]
EEITLVCVTKGAEIDKISQAIDCGISHIGENRIQEATDKYLKLKQLYKEPDKFSKIRWHMVGHLQTNKVDKAVEIFDLIQSVDSLRLAKKIDSEAKKNHKTCDILIEINTSGESSKFGLKEEESLGLIEEISKLKNIRLLGLMTIGPLSADENKIRQSFRSLRELKEKIAKEMSFPNVKMQYLSMGMTDDYRIAIEEGSNMIRLGRAIFHDA